ncbi:MAG: aspartate aminotransferase family protein [Actinobacteria bacterium]|nr:aspartate aminotransferase family protein [Actinomycetota bacterium]MBV8394771.1 aspartate aminotransferase family protein [Actinomycetota bacterium]
MRAQGLAGEGVLASRARFVARGVATPPLVVDRAEAARIWDADGREYLDFAGGIGCVNLGHRHPAIVDAIHEQVDRYLHQCFMVGNYEPYVEVCRRLDELSPCRGAEQKSVLFNSGAEAVENAVKIARAATGRGGVLVFERGFHGRTLLTLTMTEKVVYKAGFGPFAPEVYRVPAPYAFRGVTTGDALAALDRLFKAEVDPRSIACAVLEPVQGEGGFIPMPAEFLAGLVERLDAHGILFVADEVQTGVGRTGRTWAVEHTGIEPDLLVAGKSLGGGLPLASVTGRAELLDAPAPGGLGGTFSGNPVACAAANATLDVLPDVLPRADAIASTIRTRLERVAPNGSDIRGLGPMLAMELPEQKPDRAGAIAAAAFARGLILLTCGLYGNVVRLHVPLTISDEDLEAGLDLLEEAVGDAG